MLDILVKYEIDPAEVMTEDGLVKLVSIFESGVADLSEQVISTQDLEKSVRDEIGNDSELADQTEAAFRKVREVVSEILDENPESAVPLFTLLQDLKSDTGNYRDYVVSSRAKGQKRAPQNESEVEEAKSLLSELREAITSVWVLQGKPERITDGEEILFSVKTGKNGDTSPDLSRIPSVHRGNAGRGAKIRKMQFLVNGEQVPEGSLFRDVVYNQINDLVEGITYNPSDVVKIVEEAGYQFTSEEPWTVKVGTVELTGWNPGDSEEDE